MFMQPQNRSDRSGKKNLEERVEKLKEENPASKIEVWAMEHRCPLKRIAQKRRGNRRESRCG
jgi:hypothetical protein